MHDSSAISYNELPFRVVVLQRLSPMHNCRRATHTYPATVDTCAIERGKEQHKLIVAESTKAGQGILNALLKYSILKMNS
eukprot:m.534896 g.534896  ORF g.534896 m.534896 type:complete len:80 (-) comp22059_c0_seq21:2305-2544(-)